MTRDYAAEVRNRMAEIGRLPPQRHDTLVGELDKNRDLTPGGLTVCRTIGRGPGNIVTYTYTLSVECDHTQGVVHATNTDDAAALLAFTDRMAVIAGWLRREPVEPQRLKALTRHVEETT